MIAGRVLQGVAGGVFPLAFGIVRDTFPREQVAGGLAIVSAIFGIGGGIGLPLSGVIVDNLDLQWLFWISLIALPAALAAHRLVPPSPPVENTRVDWLGARCSRARWRRSCSASPRRASGAGAHPRTSAAIAGGLALSAVFVGSRGASPAADRPRVLRKPAVAATNLTGFLVGVSMFASFLIFPSSRSRRRARATASASPSPRPACC